MKRANENNYKCYLYFAAASSVKICIDRVAQRKLEGGHSVPTEKIRKRYFLSLENLLPAMRLSYRAFLFDNSHSMKIDKPFKMDEMGFAKENYPYIDALREALVNMLMHADYFSPIKSRIRIFNDKIEFFNPGGFPKPIEYFLKNDTSMPRNPILARLFRAIKLAENAGYGFDKMIEGWKTYSKEPIDFKTDLDTSTTIFYLPTPKETPNTTLKETPKETPKEILTNLENSILMEIKKDKNVSAKIIATKLDLSVYTVREYLARLNKKSAIMHRGPNKGGYWEVIQ